MQRGRRGGAAGRTGRRHGDRPSGTVHGLLHSQPVCTAVEFGMLNDVVVSGSRIAPCGRDYSSSVLVGGGEDASRFFVEKAWFKFLWSKLSIFFLVSLEYFEALPSECEHA